MSDDATLVCPVCGEAGSGAYCGKDGARRVPAAELERNDPLIGVLLAGRYAIERRIGEGGMGAVYLATQAIVDRPVVVKVILPAGEHDAQLRARFVREAKALSRVVHPNVVTIHDFGFTDEGMAYMVMEHVDGIELSDLMEVERRLPWQRAVMLVAQVARALAAAHQLGIVHRDIKPGNVMLVAGGLAGAPDAGFVKVLDFGLAKLVEGDEVRLTASHAVVGTPAFMSPEQASGREVGPATDLYALGIMLFDMIAGDVPFTGETVTDVLIKHLTTPAPPLSSVAKDAGIPATLDALVAQLLLKDPDARPALASQVADRLEAAVAEAGGSDPQVRTRPLRAQPVPEAAPAKRFDDDTMDPAGGAMAFGETGVQEVVTKTDKPHVPATAPAPARSKASPGRIGAWVLAIAVTGFLVWVVTLSLTSGPATEPTAAPATSEPRDASADTAPVAPLPPIPAPRGLRLDGLPIPN